MPHAAEAEVALSMRLPEASLPGRRGRAVAALESHRRPRRRAPSRLPNRSVRWRRRRRCARATCHTCSALPRRCRPCICLRSIAPRTPPGRPSRSPPPSHAAMRHRAAWTPCEVLQAIGPPSERRPHPHRNRQLQIPCLRCGCDRRRLYCLLMLAGVFALYTGALHLLIYSQHAQSCMLSTSCIAVTPSYILLDHYNTIYNGHHHSAQRLRQLADFRSKQHAWICKTSSIDLACAAAPA